MEQLISHLITNPAWMSLSVLFVVIFLVIFGILFLSALIQMDDKKNNTEDNIVEFYDVAGYKIYDLVDNHMSTKAYMIKKPTKVCCWKFTENKIQEIDVDVDTDA